MRRPLSLIVLFALAGCGSPGGDDSTPPAGRVLVLGDVERDEPATVAAGLKPMADLLAGRLAASGYKASAVRVAADPQTMGRWMADGEVDLYFDSAYPASVVREISGARPLLRRWKRDAAEYQSILFTRADSGLTSLENLAGRLMAFDDPASTSGYLVPMALVLEAGLQPVPVPSPDVAVDPPSVACYFTGDDADVVEWVLSGRAAGGAIDSLTWETVLSEETRDRLRVLDTSERHPRGFLMVRADLDPAVVEAVRSILLTVHESDEGRAALAAMITSRFDEFPEDACAMLDVILELRRRVEPGTPP